MDDGALQATVGGVDDLTVRNMSAGWMYTWDLSTPATVQVTINWNLTMSDNYERNEYIQLFVTLKNQKNNNNNDNDQEPIEIVRINGNSDNLSQTGITTYFWNNIPAGSQTLLVGIYNNKKTFRDEFSIVTLNHVLIASSTAVPNPTLINDSTTTTLFQTTFDPTTDGSNGFFYQDDTFQVRSPLLYTPIYIKYTQHTHIPKKNEHIERRGHTERNVHLTISLIMFPYTQHSFWFSPFLVSIYI